MNLNQRIRAFHNLGEYLRAFGESKENDSRFEALENILLKAKAHNQWFTVESSKLSLSAWANELTEKRLGAWTAPYNIGDTVPKKVGIIMAGNLPLVGFHDLLSVLISGNKALVKLSKDDSQLMPFIIDTLLEIEPQFKGFIEIIERLEKPDAVIATGSNNTARYFEAYFGGHPNIIRKNRNSVAVLSGSESAEELKLLADDLFMYFGMGCRNVTKLYLPKEFNLNRIFEAIYHYHDIGNHNKYGNNYDYYRAIYLLNQEPFLENNFAILKEHKAIGSPVGVIHYEFYEDLNLVKKELEDQQEKIQCIVSSDNVSVHSVAFGQTQKPALDDYADGVDTLEFLLNL